MTDTQLVDRLAQIEVPPAPPDFRSRLRARLDARRETTLRRWRWIAAIATTVALAATSAAGVLAVRSNSAPLDRAISCPLAIQGGAATFLLLANAAGHNAQGAYGATVLVGTGDNAIRSPLLAFDSSKSGYVIDHSVCATAAKQTIPLTRAGLPSAGTFRKNAIDQLGKTCLVAAHVTIRAHVAFSSDGAPKAAQVAIRSGAKLKPVAYINWTPTLVKTYVSSNCQDR